MIQAVTLALFSLTVYWGVSRALWHQEASHAVTQLREIEALIGTDNSPDGADAGSNGPHAAAFGPLTTMRQAGKKQRPGPSDTGTGRDQNQENDSGHHDGDADSDAQQGQVGNHEDVTDPSLLSATGIDGSYAEIRDAAGRTLNASLSLRPYHLPLPAGPSPVMQTVAGLGPLVVAAQPLPPGAGRSGWVIVGRPLIQNYRALHVLLWWLGLVGGLSLAAMGAGGWLFAGAALHPIDRITKTAQRIGKGGLDERIRLGGPSDELTRLGSAFDEMLDRLAANLEREKRFTSDASHELRTPLAALRGDIDVTLHGPPLEPAAVRPLLVRLSEEAAYLSRLVDQLLALARTDAGRQAAGPPSSLDLSLVACEACERVESAARARGVPIHIGEATEVSIIGWKDDLIRAICNLLENAIRYSPSGVPVRLSVSRDGDGARLEVEDRGVGIAPDHLPHVFDRFYCVDGARRRSAGGAGLGLAIVKAVAEAHGGSIAVYSLPGKGCRFTLFLPTVSTCVVQDASVLSATMR